MSTEYLVTQLGVDTADNEALEVWALGLGVPEEGVGMCSLRDFTGGLTSQAMANISSCFLLFY